MTILRTENVTRMISYPIHVVVNMMVGNAGARVLEFGRGSNNLPFYKMQRGSLKFTLTPA